MKASNLEKKIGNICVKILFVMMIVLVIAIFGAMVAVSFILDDVLIFYILFGPMMIVFLGIGLNYYIACLCGDRVYNTGIVRNGNSLYAVKTTPKYYKRKKFIDFIQFSLFVLLFVKFVLSFDKNEYVLSILGVIICIIGASLCFLAGLSSIEKSKF